MASCHDCKRPYGHEHGFPDLIISDGAWRRISPTGNEGGLLCPSCICQRLHEAGIESCGAFMSGPVTSVAEAAMRTILDDERSRIAPERLYRRIEQVLEGAAARGATP